MALSQNRIEFDGSVVRLMFAPVVYVAIGKDSILYVGMSKHGLGRVFDRKHHALTPDVWKEVESIQVFEVLSIPAAKTLEAHLIQGFHPKYNDRQCWTKEDRREQRGMKHRTTDIIAHFNA